MHGFSKQQLERTFGDRSLGAAWVESLQAGRHGLEQIVRFRWAPVVRHGPACGGGLCPVLAQSLEATTAQDMLCVSALSLRLLKTLAEQVRQSVTMQRCLLLAVFRKRVADRRAACMSSALACTE